MRTMLGCLICAWAMSALGCPGQPGGGGCDQFAPDSVKTGEPATLKLVLTVWGSGGEIQGRYTDLAVLYRLVGETDYRSVAPKLQSREKDRETYTAEIPAYPEGTTGEIEYVIDMKLDGHASRLAGAKTIAVRPA